MLKIKQAIPIIILTPLSLGVEAGWLGPDNYEDCVLEKMKGQTKEMIWTARTACEKQFPFEKELRDYNDNIKVDWGGFGSDLFISIKANHGDYIITKYKAQFSKKSCEESTSNSDYTLTKVFFFEAGVDTSSVSAADADKYKCMRTNMIWGRYRK